MEDVEMGEAEGERRAEVEEEEEEEEKEAENEDNAEEEEEKEEEGREEEDEREGEVEDEATREEASGFVSCYTAQPVVGVGDGRTDGQTGSTSALRLRCTPRRRATDKVRRDWALHPRRRVVVAEQESSIGRLQDPTSLAGKWFRV